MENSMLSNIRILVVSADEPACRSISLYFKELTRLIATANSAEEALPLLEGPRWDLIVCCLKLPGMNGLEFFKRVRQLRPETKLVLATRVSNPALDKKISEIGISAIVPTPVNPDSLLSSMINVLSLEKPDHSSEPATEADLDMPETVSIMELDESMIITAFIRFSKQFSGISQKTRDWIRLNFKGAQAAVKRGGQELDLPVAEIEADDNIVKLYRIPVSMMSRVFVRKQLIRDLKKGGFLAFEVKRKPTEKTLQQKIRLGAIRRTEAFIGKVGDSVTVRDRISGTIRDIFTDKNSDKIDTFDLVSHVDGIIESGTAEAISVIAALKRGDQQYAHAVDVGAIFYTAYTRWIEAGGVVSGFRSDAEILLSAILHDIGKLLLPQEITESRERFDPSGPEMIEIREHPGYSADILSGMNLPETAINMAFYHHVKLDVSLASSYPQINSYKQVFPETRLLAIVDMFQALVGDRPYKRSWPPSDAMKYIDQLAGIECDPEVWIAFRDALGWHPVGSLVELNDGSQAFVVEKAYYGLYRPSVVVTRNASAEELTHNTLLDLNTEKDVFIKKGIDHSQIYGEFAIDRFLQLQVS